MSDTTRIVTAKEAIAVIENECGLVKMISVQTGVKATNLEAWNFIAEQLLDPEHVRPVAGNPTNREWALHPRTGKRYKRQLRSERGLPKPGTKFTKKTSCTLLPKDGRISLFGGGGSVGILFDRKVYTM